MGCIHDVSLEAFSQRVAEEYTVFSKQDICSVVFMLLQKKKINPFSINNLKKVHIHQNVQKLEHKVENTTGDIQNLNSATHKTYVQSHIKHTELYTAKLTIQMTSINTNIQHYNHLFV